jgi:hypothetical protein
MDKLKIGLKIGLTLLALIVVYNLVKFLLQETCSDYQCPDGYVKNESKKDTECGGIADFTCDSNDKDTCCISKQKCSEYTCPTGYEGKDNSDKIYCKDSVCKESDDKDTCCNKSVNCEGSWSGFGACSLDCGGGTQTRTYTATKQPQYGGTPCPTIPESQACNTQACETNQDDGANDAGVVANATCSTVSGNCPDGYLYKNDSAGIACNGPTCDVGLNGGDLGVDINTCCKYCPDIDGDGFIGINDLLSSLASFGESCDGDVAVSKCLYSNRGSNKIYGANELLGLLAVYGQHCSDRFDCQTLPDTISLYPNTSSVVSGTCTSEECGLTITCNSDHSISTNWICNHSSGSWDHDSSSDLEAFNSCI